MKFNPFQHHPPLRCHPSVQRVREASILEIGPGRGDFLFELARRHPDQIVAAVEIKRKRYEKLKPRIARLGLTNIALILGDARVALPLLFQPGQIHECYVLFSDPWPKDKHTKHRLFQSYFVNELSRILKMSGHIRIAHDSQSYLEEIGQLLGAHPAFTQVRGTDKHSTLFETFYAEKWRQEGRSLSSLHYQVSAKPGQISISDDSNFGDWPQRIEILSDR